MALSYGFILGEPTTSKDFSDAVHALAGDGIAQDGGGFRISINGFTTTLSSGYALAAGRWLRNDEPLALTIPPSGNTDDRTDALAVRVDYRARAADLTVLQDIDPDKIRENPVLVRNEDEYSVFLYFIHVRRGSTALTPDDVSDLRDDAALCGKIVPLSAVSGQVLYVYQFLTSGIDREVSRLVGLSNQFIESGDQSIQRLYDSAVKRGGIPDIGELLETRRAPENAAEWLLCDGGAVPAEYAELYTLTGGKLPDISRADDRYRTYIYGGTPQT